MFLVLFEPAGSIPAGETVCNISPKVFNQTEFLVTRVLLFFFGVTMGEIAPSVSLFLRATNNETCAQLTDVSCCALRAERTAHRWMHLQQPLKKWISR